MRYDQIPQKHLLLLPPFRGIIIALAFFGDYRLFPSRCGANEQRRCVREEAEEGMQRDAPRQPQPRLKPPFLM